MTEEPQPPQDLVAEQCVLGGVMLSKDAIADAVEVLGPADFYRPAHQTVYDCVLDLYASGAAVDPVIVAAELDRANNLARVGGAPALFDMVQAVPTAANAGFYARIVADKATLRRLSEAGTRIHQLGSVNAEGDDVAEVVDQAQAALARVTDGAASRDWAALDDLMQPALQHMDEVATHGHPRGVLTGFADLDEVTNGLHPGQLVIVAARPGLGKSTVAMDWARHCALRQRMTAAVFSLEMSRTEIVERVLSAEAKVRMQDIRGGRMSDDDWVRVSKRVGELAGAPLYIDDSPDLTMSTIQAKARRLKQKHGLSLLIVDYLQLMSSGRRAESRQHEVSEFSRSLKLLAKELEVPVVAMSQLNRGPEQRGDKKPMLSDLRESGGIEQDSDVVILVHRPDAYDRDDPRAGEADLILAKHRAGPTPTITVAHQLHYSRFVDLARQQ